MPAMPLGLRYRSRCAGEVHASLVPGSAAVALERTRGWRGGWTASITDLPLPFSSRACDSAGESITARGLALPCLTYRRHAAPCAAGSAPRSDPAAPPAPLECSGPN